jgi:hypothetical protein
VKQGSETSEAMIPDAIYVDETEGQQDEIINIMEDE